LHPANKRPIKGGGAISIFEFLAFFSPHPYYPTPLTNSENFKLRTKTPFRLYDAEKQKEVDLQATSR
jgi:hypothetical protein